jgi:putative ABC transport system ATP-binding protein
VTAIIEAKQLGRVYAGTGAPVTALDGVSLAVQSGEFVAIMGPSGCGKSTLLHLLGGLDHPTAGEVWFEGERVDGLSETAWAVRRRRGIGIVFQFFNLIGNLSAADNVELPALIAGASAAEARRERERLMAELGISERARAMPAVLSGGEQQRVAIARALINDPRVLLADEPTGNLDTESARDVLALLRGLHERGQTIILVTHDPRVAAQADRVLRMRDGRIAAESQLEDREDRRRIVAELVELEV